LSQNGSVQAGLANRTSVSLHTTNNEDLHPRQRAVYVSPLRKDGGGQRQRGGRHDVQILLDSAPRSPSSAAAAGTAGGALPRVNKTRQHLPYTLQTFYRLPTFPILASSALRSWPVFVMASTSTRKVRLGTRHLQT